MSSLSKRLSVVSLLIFIVFLPSLFAELSSVDDLDMHRWLSRSGPSLKELFFPQVAGGAYYRPLIGVSYLFDKYVWLLDTRLMHLDNLLFHLVNALLVYYLSYQFLTRDDRQKSMLPALSSLIFGLHPITSESVAWISGRTDIMACSFVLLSTVFLFKFRETARFRFILLSLLFLMPGLLIKETPLAFLLGALFIIISRKEDVAEHNCIKADVYGEIVRCSVITAIASLLLLLTYSVWPVFICGLAYFCLETVIDKKSGKAIQPLRVFIVSIGIVLPVGLFFLIRKIVFSSNISSVGNTLKLITGDLNYAFQTFFGAAGFYVRKFFLPFPLNFAIREIDPLYNVCGVAVFFLCLYAIHRKSVISALFLTGVCLFLPALPLSLGTITWTAYAERYIYMSTAFWALAVSLWGWRQYKHFGNSRIIVICSTVLVLVMGGCTFKRSLLWTTNLGILEDTVKKTPGFKIIRVDYMTALMGSGNLEGAKEQYRIAQSIPSIGYMESLDINMAALYVLEGNTEEAEKLYNHVIKKTSGKSLIAYSAYISYLQGQYASKRIKHDGSDIIPGVNLVENMEQLFRLSKDPMLLYRSGQLSIAMNRCDEALRLFSKAAEAFPPQSEFALVSNRLSNSLKSGKCRQEGK